MTTFALIGAGPGLGLAAARRFAGAGHAVALLSRHAGRLATLVAELSSGAAEVRAFTADVLDAESLRTALRDAADALGPVEILQYSPAPRADFMRTVLDTGADDLDAPLSFSVKGPVTAVDAVLPGMRELGGGTVLFVNGASAVRPNPKVAGTSVAYAAQSAYARMLHDVLAPENVHVAQLIVPGAIRPGAGPSSPGALADVLYDMHRRRDGFRRFAEPLPD
ncbi:SDR family NAD(P)-dependent oxidoreductase [Streptomyces sp. 4F14]|uniref:SDR family NAD(P)-dependent oxidoreductase n=1 Tax=Streptomyces sp. 4F14 TaxID=3394380 RepID=UPI003A8828EF